MSRTQLWRCCTHFSTQWGVSVAVFFIVMVLSLGTVAQSYYFKHYGGDQGLESHTITSVCQDKQGFIWLGTYAGVYRFDGYRFKLFTCNDAALNPFADQKISSLIVDKNGTIWAGTQNGVIYFELQTGKFVRLHAPAEKVKQLMTDNRDNIWIIYEKKLARYTLTSKVLTIYPTDSKSSITSVCMATDGSIWAYGTDLSLRKFDPDLQRFSVEYDLSAHSSSIVNPPNYSKIINVGDNHFMILAYLQPLKLFNKNSGAYKNITIYNDDKNPAMINDLIQYGPNEFWAATGTGIFILSLDNRNNLHFVKRLHKKNFDPYSLSDNVVYSLCKDNEGGVWAGTYFGGLNYYSPQNSVFEKYYLNNSGNTIIGNVVKGICEDRYGNIWFGTEDGGLNKLSATTGIIEQFKSSKELTSLSSHNIQGLLPLGYDLWIGTFFNGLNIMDIRTGKIRKRFYSGAKVGALKGDFVPFIDYTRTGQILLGTSRGVFRYVQKTSRFLPFQAIPENILAKVILEDSFGGLWIATGGSGLYYVSANEKITIHYTPNGQKNNSLPVSTVNALMEDHNKNIWIALENGGLLVLDSNRKKVAHYTAENILPSNFVFKMLEDDQHAVWVTTNKGLCCINPQNGHVRLFTRDDGLLDDEFNYNSGFKSSEGRLYFGSLKGMISFLPNEIPFVKSFISPLYITGLQQGDKEFSVNPGSLFRLPYDQSTFSIDFAALNYTSPETIQYSYKMEGLDRRWTLLKQNRRVYFNNLPAGKYIFKVKAIKNGILNPTERQFSIEITPPFYLTRWAYLFYLFLTGGMLFFITRSYKKRTRIRQERAIYNANMDFFTNVAHEIKTPLTLINGPVDNLIEKVGGVPEIQSDLSILNRNVKRLTLLMNHVLDFRKTEAHRFRLVSSRINVSVIIKEVYNDFLPLIQKKKSFLFV